MTVVDRQTGEIVDDLTRDEAERLSTRIGTRLDTIADNYSAVMPMIREAITRNAHMALGFRSAGEYAAERFGDALSKLDPAMRREVVRELTEAGMSTRAIAPVVGVSHTQVRTDQSSSGVNNFPPDDQKSESPQMGPTGPIPESQANHVRLVETPRPVVVGIDGKAYTPPKARPPVVAQSGDEQAVELIDTVARNLTILSQVIHANRRTAIREAFPIACATGKVSPTATDRFTPEQMRAVADGLHDLADEWEQQ